MTSDDPVNHPAHYTVDKGIECIDAIEATLTPEEFYGYLRGQVIKYVSCKIVHFDSCSFFDLVSSNCANLGCIAPECDVEISIDVSKVPHGHIKCLTLIGSKDHE